MAQGAQRSRILLVLRALAALATVAALVVLYAHITLRVEGAGAGLLREDMAGDSGGAGSGSDSPGGYGGLDSPWELPAQSPTVSKESPTGPKNETELEDIPWQSDEELSDILTLLMEIPDALKREPVDEEAPQEGDQAVPVPGKFTGAVAPTGVPGVDMRKLGSYHPKAVAGRAEYPDTTAKTSSRSCLLAVACTVILLCLYMVILQWVKDVNRCLTAWRARFCTLDSQAQAEASAVEV